MQTIHNPYPGKYIQGQIIENRVIRTYASANTTSFKAGYVVNHGANEGTITLPTAAFASTAVAGIAGYTGLAKEKDWTTGTWSYDLYDDVSVLEDGIIAVYFTQEVTQTDITAGAKPYFVHTAGGASTVYTFRKDADTDKASVIEGRIIYPVIADSLGLIKINNLI